MNNSTLYNNAYENICDRMDLDPYDDTSQKMLQNMIETNYMVRQASDEEWIQWISQHCECSRAEYIMKEKVLADRHGSQQEEDYWTRMCLQKWTDEDYSKDKVDPAELPDGIYECWKCKRAGRLSKKTKYYSMQTRSSDEPMTNFVSCLVCGQRWLD